LLEKVEIASGEIDGIVGGRPRNRELRHSAVSDSYLGGAGGEARGRLKKAGIEIQPRNHLGGLLAWPNYTHYCVSKAGVIMLTRCLARALAPEITVNAIAPGTISFPGDAPELAADFISRAPLQRTGTAKDIEDTVVFLAQSAFVTGQVIVVDGGRTLT